MTQEDKELLLKDLCGRLPYGIKCNVPYLKDIRALACIQYDAENTLFDFWDNNESYCRLQLFLSEFKPYLFPMSSMTEEQNDSWRDAWFPDLMSSTDINYPESEKYLALSHYKSMDWLYKHHFDVNGLIEKGLAIDATGLNIY